MMVITDLGHVGANPNTQEPSVNFVPTQLRMEQTAQEVSKFNDKEFEFGSEFAPTIK